MAAMPVGQRQYHAFLSHAHVDHDHAERLYRLLQDTAGVKTWYDAVSLAPGSTIATDLYSGIENSRALVLLLSHESVARGWVQQEYQAALDHQTHHPGFRIVPVRLDDVAPPNFLGNYSCVDVRPDGLDGPSAARLFAGLYKPHGAAIDVRGGRTTYVSRGWRPDDTGFAGPVCAAMRRAGLQLVGDAEDQDEWSAERVAHIMAGCGAFLGLPPRRPTSSAQGHTTSKYVLREWTIAAELGLPCLVLPQSGVTLPDAASELPGLVPTPDDAAYDDLALDLADEWRAPSREPYVFYATDFEADRRAMRSALVEVVESTTALPCRIGEYVQGERVQEAIIASVAGASLVLADITGGGENVLIEVGAARAAGVPLAVLRHGPPGRPPFMIRDRQVWDYADDAELVARAVRVSYPFRRSLLREG